MEIKDIKPKYRIGDTFREKGVRSFIWWNIDKIEIGVVEPIYTLTTRPFDSCKIVIGESALDEKYYKTSISNF
jgi:hypothetical protein